ncbi:carbohydrate-binding family 9-like protein [Actinomyces sp. F1_1611]
MYQALKVPTSVGRDLKVDSPLWDQAAKSPRFVNIVNGKRALYQTQVAVLWSEEHLFVRYWAQEPYLSGTMLERDQLLFNENNVELFIDGGPFYYELEISANNVVYEVLFAWRDYFDSHGDEYPELDPMRRKAYTFGGNNDRESDRFWLGDHPRGVRWAYTDWDLPGLETQVQLHGTINDDSDVDEGWDTMIKIPWSSLELLANGRSLPPAPGDRWAFQFARYERLEELGINVGWAWTPVGDKDNHVPERFTPIEFSAQELS